MWRKLFSKTDRIVEVVSPSNQRRVMSQSEYIDKVIKENRLRSELGRNGLTLGSVQVIGSTNESRHED